jgi:hypothetical protein
VDDTDDRRTTVGLLDRLLGRTRRDPYASRGPDSYPQPSGQVPPAPATEDQRAIERYRYLLKTAPPDQIEEAHAEAFARLTPEQRRQVLDQLATTGERPQGDDPRSLARAATRAEVRQPGSLERAFGGGGYGGGYGPGYGGGFGGGFGGPGFGSMVGGSLLGTIGGLVIGTAVADALFDTGMGDGGLFGGGDEEAYAEGYEDGAQGDGGDGSGGEDAGYVAEGDSSGDYGGGDYGGGDFGGGDFGGGGDF